MPLSSDEAAETLRDIDRTERRSANAYGYRAGAPHLILWGVIWAIGYGINDFRPQWSAAWIPLVIAGTIGSFWIGAHTRPENAKYDWRFTATLAAVIAFVSALFAIMPPHTDIQTAAFFPVLVSLFYMLMGIWTKGARIFVLGVAVGALTMVAYFKAPQQFSLWMAAVGGGGLILGGLWLRTG